MHLRTFATWVFGISTFLSSTASSQDRRTEPVLVPLVTEIIAGGARSVNELARSDVEARLRRCRAEARAAHRAEALIRLRIDPRGRVTAATVLAEGEVGTAMRRWHRCATRVLYSLRFAAGGAGSFELVVRWELNQSGYGSNFGFGNLGSLGHDSGSGDSPSGVSRIRFGEPEVRGALSVEVIQREAQRHINEVRFCYEQELTVTPTLTGRIDVAFTIAPSGAVTHALIAAETTGSPRVTGCVAQAVRRWTFPIPEDGSPVRVTYPITFTTEP